MHALQRQAGLTLVELLIGIAIGLLLTVGAINLFLSHLDASRRLLLEARLNQNVRSATEIITRDLRRAGHWDQVIAKLGTNTGNPNQDITSSVANIAYAYSAPAGAASDVQITLLNNRLQMKLGGGTAQALTDPTVARITGFRIVKSENQIDIGHQHIPALPANTQCLAERRYDIIIEAEAPTDASVRRRLHTSARVRNDFVGNCS